MHYVGGLKRNQSLDLFNLPESEYIMLEGITGSRALRRKKVIYGQEMIVVAVYNQNLYDGQILGVTANIQKIYQSLSELQEKLTHA
jgi:hypothetical protein